MASHSDYGFVSGVLAVGLVSITGCNQIVGFKDVSLQGDATTTNSGSDAQIDGSAGHDAAHDGPPPQLFVFVTDSSANGGFGAAMGARKEADARCTAMYNMSFSTLGCTNIRAVIQVDDATDSLAGMKNNYSIPGSSVKRATDNTLLVGSWDAFIDPSAQLSAAISIETPPVRVWTGRAGGTNLQCTHWTSAANAEFGTTGDATKSFQWTAQANIHCDDFDERFVCVCW